MNIEDITHEIRNNVHNKQFYQVTTHMKNCIEGFMSYMTIDGVSMCELDREDYHLPDILKAVPDFQRDNDKWTKEMQISFVENVLRGFRTHILLFDLGTDTTMADCKILDGLQRMTALLMFRTGEIKAFGKTFKELSDAGLIKGHRGGTVELRVYSFDSYNDVIDFYVAMNENITHSPEDIQKALSFKEKV